MSKFSVILGNVGQCSDRYMTTGYSEAYTTQELFDRVGPISDVTGVELVSGANITKENIDEIKGYLKKYNLTVSSIIPNHFSLRRWKLGAFTSPDKEVRRQAIKDTFEAIDIAKAVGCDLINIWNGQDGWDYPLQVDYVQTAEWLIEGIRECADYAPDVKIALEYKPKEPRTYSFVSNVFSALYYVNKIDRENVGITIDTGHALEAYENMAAAASIALKEGKLFHLHLNDNYRLWDDDMVVGAIHVPEYIELMYWLKKLGFDGWLSMDLYPYREDGAKAVEESIKWLKAFSSCVDKMDEAKVKEITDKHDSIGAINLIRSTMF